MIFYKISFIFDYNISRNIPTICFLNIRFNIYLAVEPFSFYNLYALIMLLNNFIVFRVCTQLNFWRMFQRSTVVHQTASSLFFNLSFYWTYNPLFCRFFIDLIDYSQTEIMFNYSNVSWSKPAYSYIQFGHKCIIKHDSMEETIFRRKIILVQKIVINTIHAIDPRYVINMLKRINILSPKNYHFDDYWKLNSTPKCNQIHLIFMNILVHILNVSPNVKWSYYEQVFFNLHFSRQLLQVQTLAKEH